MRPRQVALICAALLITFTTISWLAVSTKSATMDEPLHAIGAYLHVVERDYRINPEDPPLWNYFAMLPSLGMRLPVDRQDEIFQTALHNTGYEAIYTVRAMYFNPGFDPDQFLARTRFMMLLIGAVLGACIAFWGWKIGGAFGAIVPAALYALDPNFIAHAPLVKNDVVASLCFLAIAMLMWHVGRRATWWNVLSLALMCGVAMSVKFSGVLIAPILGLMLIARVMQRDPWIMLGRTLEAPGAKIAGALGVAAISSIATVIVIWTSYGFRFPPTPVTGERLDMQTQVAATKRNVFFLDHDQRYPTDAELSSMPDPLVVRAVLFAERHRLLPQPYLYGFLFTYQSALVRSTFLLGEHSVVGWWYYFPLAMLFKTPLTTLALFGLVPIVVFTTRRTFGKTFDYWWTTICLTIPIVVYGTSALTTNLNLGLRHVLPIYPFVYLMIGRIASRCSWRALKPVAIGVALLLGIETLAAFPNYISYFNGIASPYRLKLLSDSNLDWGQDLPALAEWQARNPSIPLYLGYFGSAPPQRYGLRYYSIPGGYFLERGQEQWPEQRGGVIAISALILQGTGLPPSLRKYYAPLREQRPREILGGSIYLYDVPAPPLPRP